MISNSSPTIMLPFDTEVEKEPLNKQTRSETVHSIIQYTKNVSIFLWGLLSSMKYGNNEIRV